MRVDTLIEHLKMFGEDTEVYITTEPDDMCQPVTRKLISMIKANHSEKYGLQQPKILLTACIPSERRQS